MSYIKPVLKVHRVLITIGVLGVIVLEEGLSLIPGVITHPEEGIWFLLALSMGNISSRAGLQPAPLACQVNVVTVTPHWFPDAITLCQPAL